MDRAHFFLSLAKLSGTFEIMGGGILRTSGERCPIIAVLENEFPQLKDVYENCMYQKAARHLGMSEELAHKIAASADGCRHSPEYDHAFYGDMLKVLGLNV